MKRLLPILLLASTFVSCVKDRVTAPISATGAIAPGDRTLIHYWNFNSDDPNVILEPNFTRGGGAIDFVATTIDAVSPGSPLNARNGDDSANGLRVRNPSTDITFKVPTTGYKQPLFTFVVERSGNGAQQNTITYTIDGDHFTDAGLQGNVITVTETWEAFSLDFSGVPGVDDNPNFAVRVTFSAGNDNPTGNDRYENVTVDALPK